MDGWELGLTSLQEGDIIRLLRRVLDLLRQIPRLPYVPGTRGVDAQLRLNARRALTIMDRCVPVCRIGSLLPMCLLVCPLNQ
jgi:superfamily II RNA helicase